MRKRRQKARQKENRMTFGLCHIRLLSHQIRVPLGRHVLQYIVALLFSFFTPSIDRRPANQFQFGEEQLLLIFFYIGITIGGSEEELR